MNHTSGAALYAWKRQSGYTERTAYDYANPLLMFLLFKHIAVLNGILRFHAGSDRMTDDLAAFFTKPFDRDRNIVAYV